LQWLTERYGEGTVPELNELLKDAPYDEHIFKTVTGRKVAKLWKLYKEHLGGGGGDGDGPTKDDPPTSEPEVTLQGLPMGEAQGIEAVNR